MKPKTKQDIDPFEEILDAKREAAGVQLDSDLTAAQLKELVAEFKKAVKDRDRTRLPRVADGPALGRRQRGLR